MKLSSVPKRHSSIRIFLPALPNKESCITASTQFFALFKSPATNTPLPAANPSAFKTMGYVHPCKKLFAFSESVKEFAAPVGMPFSNINSLE